MLELPYLALLSVIDRLQSPCVGYLLPYLTYPISSPLPPGPGLEAPQTFRTIKKKAGCNFWQPKKNPLLRYVVLSIRSHGIGPLPSIYTPWIGGGGGGGLWSRGPNVNTFCGARNANADTTGQVDHRGCMPGVSTPRPGSWIFSLVRQGR